LARASGIPEAATLAAVNRRCSSAAAGIPLQSRSTRRGTEDDEDLALAAAALALSATMAAAQSHAFYSANGSFNGSAVARGNSASFYGANGHLGGQRRAARQHYVILRREWPLPGLVHRPR